MIDFKWISNDHINEVYFPSLSHEYTYLCLDSSGGKSLFLDSILYKKYNWYIARNNNIDCAVLILHQVDDILFLKFIEVSEFYKHKGIGTKIIKKLIEISKKNNIIEIRLEPRSEKLKKFYESIGFIENESNKIEMYIKI